MCYVCFFEFKDAEAMKIHKETNHSTFKCVECSYLTTGESFLKLHMIIHLKKKSAINFDCTECGKTFGSKGRLREHVSSVHMNLWLKCSECDSKFDRRDSLVRHTSSVHSKPCKLCDFKGSSSDQLKKHMQSHEINCDICDFSTNDHAKFVRHMTKKHQSCKNCAFVAESRKDFAKHRCIKSYKTKEEHLKTQSPEETGQTIVK